jgi:hypothetical protein
MKKEIKSLAKKYGFSEQTVETLLNGLIQSGGNQVQFNIGELGGMGQWQGGMVMIGDMFNNYLKSQVSNLCYELVELIRNIPVKEEKKEEAFTFKGGQNEMTYTYFADKNRLEIKLDKKTEKYDTSGHYLVGAQQQQSNDTKDLKFQSQEGKTLTLKDFKKLKK